MFSNGIDLNYGKTYVDQLYTRGISPESNKIVYIYFTNTTINNFESFVRSIFYVGMGSEERCAEHIQNALIEVNNNNNNFYI